MTVPDLMSALRAHGATLMLQGDSVKVTARAPLPDALTVALRAHKADIVAALQGEASQAPAALPPVHDTDDPWEKPSASCAACGAVHWRVWCHDERKVWQWICNGCRPLVVINPDGTRWPA